MPAAPKPPTRALWLPGLRLRNSGHSCGRSPSSAASRFESSFANRASRRSISAWDFAMVSLLSWICLASLSRSRRMDTSWCCALGNGGSSGGAFAKPESSPAPSLARGHPCFQAGPPAHATGDRDSPATWRSICRGLLWPSGSILQPGREGGQKGLSLARNVRAGGRFGTAGKIGHRTILRAAQSPRLSLKTEQSRVPHKYAGLRYPANQASASSRYGQAPHWHIPCHPLASAHLPGRACARETRQNEVFLMLNRIRAVARRPTARRWLAA